jgi:hypothetical protein
MSATAGALFLTAKARGCFLSVKKQPPGMRNTVFCAVKRSGSENCYFYKGRSKKYVELIFVLLSYVLL